MTVQVYKEMPNAPNEGQMCGTYYSNSSSGDPEVLKFTCEGGLVGRYIRIKLTNLEIDLKLGLCEV